MHFKQDIIRLVAGMTLVALTVAAGGCDGSEETAESKIDIPSIVDEKPDAEKPRILFPPNCQQEDVSLNKAIQQVLEICERGDYDGFCKLFGTSEVPPSHDDFQRIWHGVAEIAVRSVHFGGEEPLQYFVHAVVKLRQPDADKRTERDIVVRVYKEMDQWRLAGASKEVIRKVLTADTRPASGPAREAAAPASGPAVYKAKSL